jgi:4-amino-4-deoxy-L-arabinose transferase-like glycosyltransferase
MPTTNRPARAAAVALVFLAALGVRLAFYAARGPFVTSDGTDYARIARNIREHGTYSLSVESPFAPTSKRAPLYPAFLAVFDPDADAPPFRVFAAQCLLDSLVAVLVLWLAAGFLPPGWAVGAGLAYAVHPAPVLYASFLLSESLFTALLALAVAAVAAAVRTHALRWAAAAGTAAGLAALCRPVALLLPLALALVVVAYAPPKRWAHAALVVVCALAVVVPWIARSSRLEGRFVPVQRSVSAKPMAATRLEDRIVVSPDGTTTDPAAAGASWIAGDILSHPFRFLGRCVWKTPQMVLSGYGLVNGIEPSVRELAASGRYDLLAIKLGMMALFAALPLALAWVGLLRVRGAPAAGACAAVCLYQFAVHMPFWVEYRFWVPATPFMLVGAVAGAHVLFARVRQGRRVAS